MPHKLTKTQAKLLARARGNGGRVGVERYAGKGGDGGRISGGVREWGAAMALRDAGVLEVVRIESGVVYSYGGNGCQVTSCLLKLTEG